MYFIGYCYYKKILPESLNIIKGENDLKKEYPFDIALNAVIIDGKLFHNLKYTDKALLKYCQNKNIEFVNVKQGYTKCSICPIDENTFITGDISIARAGENAGCSVLLITNDNILLSGFSNGFWGGCCGMGSSDTLLVNGDIDLLPSGEKIKEFLKEKNIKIKNLKKGDVIDIGSVIPLMTT